MPRNELEATVTLNRDQLLAAFRTLARAKGIVWARDTLTDHKVGAMSGLTVNQIVDILTDAACGISASVPATWPAAVRPY